MPLRAFPCSLKKIRVRSTSSPCRSNICVIREISTETSVYLRALPCSVKKSVYVQQAVRVEKNTNILFFLYIIVLVSHFFCNFTAANKRTSAHRVHPCSPKVFVNSVFKPVFGCFWSAKRVLSVQWRDARVVEEARLESV